jgi:hypothetical protein
MKMIFICLVFCFFVPFIGNAADTNKLSVLSPQSKIKMLSIADEQPKVMEILLPEQVGFNTVPVRSLPKVTTSNAVSWIQKVVQSRWLPPNVETAFVAAKDVKLWEKKDKKGVVFSEYKGDFLLLNYSISNHTIHIQESGVTVSIRIDFAEPQPVTANPTLFAQKCLVDFLNIPIESAQNLSVESFPPLYKVKLVNKQPTDPSHWWDGLEAYIDSNFFFVTVPEIGIGSSPRAKPGLPDRF